MQYVDNAGVPWNYFDSALCTASRMGRGYLLPSNEVVLVPTDYKPDYPCFIFQDRAAFLEMKRADYYPIPPPHMSWLERHAPQLQGFPHGPAFYDEGLQAFLGTVAPLATLSDCRPTRAPKRTRTNAKRNSSIGLPWP
jgi:hypothetical protein